MTKSLARRESCGASTNETEAPAAERDGASLSPSPTKRTRARQLSRARIQSSLAETVMAPRACAKPRSAPAARPAPGVARKQHGLPDAGAAKLFDDRVRARPKLLGEREERRPVLAVGQEGH